VAEVIAVIKQVLVSPEMLLGLVACLGLIILRRGLSKIIIGTTKTILGVLLLFAGADLIVRVLTQLTPIVREVFGTEGLLPMTAVLLSAGMEMMGSTITAVLLGGFVVNLLLARFTRWKFVFLAGNQMLWISLVLPLVVGPFGLDGITRIVVCSVLAGMIYIYLPAVTNRYMKAITGDQPIAMGHMGCTGYWLAGVLGKYLGDARTSTEDLKLSGRLEFLKDNVVVTAIVIAVLFLAFGFAAGGSFVTEELAAQGVTTNWVLNSIFQGLWFAGGMAVILYGVRMMLSELVPAFQGIAEKIVPNAVPALDCPVVYPFAPTAVVVGFIASLLGGAVATFAVKVFGGLFVVPPIMEHFFMGGTAGVFGNSTGGRRGAVIGGALNGVFFTVLPVVLWQFTRLTVNQPVTAVDTDLCIWGTVVGTIAKLLHMAGLF